MKIYKISILFILLMIFSVGFVFAEDVNQTDANLEMADNGDVVSVGESKTYTNLSDDIDTVTNLTSDYIYNNEIDKTNIIEINASELTINGNNHSIDGSNMAGVFLFKGKSNVTINDLTFKNCGATAIGIIEGSKVTFNNVKFINNNEITEGSSIYCLDSVVNVNNVLFENNTGFTGGAIYATNSKVNITNSLFKNNNAENGGAIFTSNGNLYLNNATFTNKNPLTWSLIYAFNATVLVENSTFANSTSKYATALFSQLSRLSITGTKFENLYANATAGAIGVKKLMKLADPAYASLVIQDCIFSNVTSEKDAGAVYVDVNGDVDGNELVLINNTLFEKGSSEFAGAVMQLGGRLNLLDSIFKNNMAYYSGGAIYVSNVSSDIVGCEFLNNIIPFNDLNSKGGALFLDYGRYKVQYCNFTNNSAYIGGGVYAFDSYLEVTNSTFDNNDEGIHGVFLTEDSIYDVTSTNDTFNMTDKNYPTYVFFTGKKIVLDPIAVTGSVNDTFFDLRKFGAVTPVQNQGSMGACWAFATVGAFESAFKKATNITLTISTNNMQNSGLRYSIYGKPELTEGGYIFSGLGYLLSWLGVLNIEYDSYDELGKISPVLFTRNNYHVQDAALINTSDITAMKDALIKYGGLSVLVEGAVANNMYYNQKTNSSYCNNESRGNHFVTIVGWNDTFSKEDFLIDPGHDGAWIVKNSWGTEWADEGYYYLSYYDMPLRKVPGIAYVLNNTVDVYDKLYQYDVSCIQTFHSNEQGTNMTYRNTFENFGGSLISAVGTYFESENQDYKITLYVNGNKVHTQEGKSKFMGFETIKLTKQIAVGHGEKFAVEIETQSVPLLGNTRGYYENGSSIMIDGDEIIDLSAKRNIAAIKAYAFNNNGLTVPDVTVSANEKATITAILTDYYANPLAGEKIIVNINGWEIETYTAENGIATIDVPFAVGNYSVNVTYKSNGSDITKIANLTIKDINKADINIISIEGTKVTGVLKDNNGNIISNATISYTIGNKTSNITTDDNGEFIIPAEIGKEVLIKYNGSDSINGANTTFTIKDRIETMFESQPYSTIAIDYYAGERGNYFEFYLKDKNGNPLANKKVFIGFNGKTYNKTTDENGLAKLQINLASAGTYTFAMGFLGDENCTGAFMIQKITVTKKKTSITAAAKTYKVSATKKYTVTLKTNKGNSIDGKTYLKPGKKVTLLINGKTYTAKTNEKGQATFNIKLTKKGIFNSKITFAGDNTYKASSKSVKITIK